MTARMLALLGAGLLGTPLLADQVINDDLIVVGNACVGFDCSVNQTFPVNGIELEENNTRISFDSGAFVLAANQNTNGGLNEFRIDTSGLVRGSDATGRTQVTFLPTLAATVMPDGRLRIDLSEAPNAISIAVPQLSDATLTVTDPYAYVPAGSFTLFSGGTFFIIDENVPVTSDSGTTFSYTGTGSVANMTFATVGTGVTLGRGSTRQDGAVSVGAAGAERRVTGVADAVADDDLINLRQLQAAITPADLAPAISAEAGRLDGVSATTAALSAIQPNPRATGPLAVSLGLGFYEGETAVAAGLTWQTSEAALLKISFADSDQSEPMTALSLSFAW